MALVTGFFDAREVITCRYFFDTLTEGICVIFHIRRTRNRGVGFVVFAEESDIRRGGGGVGVRRTQAFPKMISSNSSHSSL